jgi:hypothetical protein
MGFNSAARNNRGARRRVGSAAPFVRTQYLADCVAFLAEELWCANSSVLSPPRHVDCVHTFRVLLNSHTKKEVAMYPTTRTIPLAAVVLTFVAVFVVRRIETTRSVS